MMIEEKAVELLEATLEELHHASEEALTWAHAEYHVREAIYKLHELKGMFYAVDRIDG